MTLITILGIIATVSSLLVSSVGIYSQIVKNFKTRSCGIDIVYISLIFLSYSSWTVYSIVKGDVFIFIPHLLGIIFASIIIWQYFRFNR
jgi:uncharacterized membrane protein